MMENLPKHDAKYHKLASEYSKLRGQANVLKKAVLEEQNKSVSLQEALRLKETALRRAEQELDSLGFRNKQLEHRVRTLQDDLESKSKSTSGGKSSNKSQQNHQSTTSSRLATTTTSTLIGSSYPNEIDPKLFTEELEKKITEHAQLISLLDDKSFAIQLNENRIHELEDQLKMQSIEHRDFERKSRKETELLSMRNTELETKLLQLTFGGDGGSVSIIGSDDTLSVTGSDHTPIHTTIQIGAGSSWPGGPVPSQSSSASTVIMQSLQNGDERIIALEKDVCHWRTKYEFLKITHDCSMKNITEHNYIDRKSHNHNGSSSAVHHLATTKTITSNNNENGCISSDSDISSLVGDDDHKICDFSSSTTAAASSSSSSPSSVIYNNSSNLHRNERAQIIECLQNKLHAIILEKVLSESKSKSFQIECTKLQKHLEILHNELSSIEQKFKESQGNLQISDEDLAITRKNYEEQISILTEQMINLSTQLADLK